VGRTSRRLVPSRGHGKRAAVSLLLAVGATVGAAALRAGEAAAATTLVVDVTTTADVIDPSDGVVSLREAVLLAAATPGDVGVRLIRGAVHALACPLGGPENAGISGDLDHHTPDVLVLVGRGATLTYEPGCNGHRLLDAGPLVVRNLVVTSGSASAEGGAIRSTASVEVRGSVLESNSSGSAGGAIWAHGPVMVRRSTFARNSGVAGGAIRAPSDIGTPMGGNRGGLWVHQLEPVLISDSVLYPNLYSNEVEESWGVGGGLHGRGIFTLRSTGVVANVAGSLDAGLFFDTDTNAELVGSEVTLNVGNDVPGITGPGTGTTFVADDPTAVHHNVGAVTGEIGGVVLL